MNYKGREVSDITNLFEGEEIVWELQPSKNFRRLIMSRDLFLIIVSTLIFHFTLYIFDWANFFISFILLLLLSTFVIFNQVKMKSIKYILTTERIIFKRGILNTDFSSIFHSNVTDIKVRQKLSEKLIKTGTIYIYTANDSGNSGDSKEWLNKVPSMNNISDPFKNSMLIEKQMRDTKIISKNKE